jgi:hypothetical protein
MSNKFLIGLGLAFALVFLGAIAAVVGITSATDRVIMVDDSPPARPAGSASVADSAPAPAPLAASVDVRPWPAAGATPASAAAVAVTVDDSDLAALAAAVKLGASSTGDVSRDVWAQQLPVAQRLLKGMCDCDQRNWLVHFVQAGQEALSGSSHFPESIQLLTTLRRGNHDLSSNQPAR